MAQDLDVNKVAAEFLVAQETKLLDLGKGVYKTARGKLRLKLRRTYTKYVGNIFERYCRSKSFFIRTEPIQLYDFYVPLDLVVGRKTIANPSAEGIASKHRLCTVCGTAGSGKSMFMKHLLLSSLLAKKRMPVFVELRELNDTKECLEDAIYRSLVSNGLNVEPAYVEAALDGGHFLLLLDGFDEVSLSRRTELGRSIRELGDQFQHTAIVVSSRPDSAFDGWQRFSCLSIKPLTLQKAQALVAKLPYDEEMKQRFLTELGKGLYREHESFLSNPLLLSIMLLTYGQSADIPAKISVFYRNAYEALFERHDALKAGYKRDRRCGLDIADFERVLAAFSLQTYDQGQFQFTRSAALAYAKTASDISRIPVSAEDFIDDALQAVSLLVEDGMQILFAHRSFQEFFTAEFMAYAEPPLQERLIQRYAPRITTDSVIEILHELKPEAIEEHYILKGLQKLRTQLGINRKVGITHYAKHIKQSFTSFTVSPDGDDLWGALNDSMSWSRDLVNFILRRYGHLVGWVTANEAGDPPDYMEEKYAEDGFILTENLTYRDTFMRDLAEHGILFSKRALEAAFAVGVALEAKRRDVDKSLAELLK